MEFFLHENVYHITSKSFIPVNIMNKMTEEVTGKGNDPHTKNSSKSKTLTSKLCTVSLLEYIV